MKIDLLKHSRELIVIYDPQGFILDVSPSVFHLLEYQKNELIGKSFSYLMHPDDDHIINFSSISLQSSGSSEIKCHHRFRNFNNQYVWFHSVFALIKNDINEILGVSGSSFILPESNSQVYFFENLEHKCEFLSKHSLDIISVHDLNGNLIYISPEIKKLSGFHPSELEGKSVYDNIHPEDIEMVKKGSVAMILEGFSSVVEYRSQKKDGSYLWFETRSTVIFDNAGAPYQILCMNRDITIRKTTEIELKESQQRYQALFDCNPDAIFSMDLDGVITDINEAAVQMAQCSKEIIIGALYSDIAHQEDKEMYVELFQKGKNGLIKKVNVETTNVIGKKISIDIIYVPIKLEGETIGVSSIARDVTEILKLQNEKELLYLISSHIDNDETLKIAIDNALGEICAFFGSILGEIWFPVSSGKYMKLQNYYFKNDPALQKFVDASKTIKVKPGQGMQGSTWKTRQTTWHENILNEPFFIRREHAANAGIKSCISVPMMFKDECIAVLTLFYDYHKNEEEQLMEFLHTISNSLASEISKRKSAEELNLFFDKSSDLLCIAGFDGYYKKINNSFEKVLGHYTEDIMEKTFYNFIHPDDVEVVKFEINALEDGEPVQYFENRILCKDGNYKWFEWTAQSLPDQQMFFCIGRDISYQKAKEEELLRIKLAVEGTNDAIAILDLDRKPFYHNKAFLDVVGYSPEELSYIGSFPAIYADRRQYDKVYKKIMKGHSFEGDIQLISKKRKVIDFNIRANIIYNKRKEDIGLLIIFTNISERIKMEKKIQNEKYFAESTINALPGIFYMIDTKGRFRRWNKNFEVVSQFSSREISQMSLLDFFKREERNRISLKIKEVFDRGKSYTEASFLQKSGSSVPFYFTGILTKVNNENFLLGFGLDITERIRAEVQLKEAHIALAQRAEELIASNEELENFAYIASHDLQEPLRMITGFIQLLQNKYNAVIDEEGQQYLEYILEGAERMKALILDLLEYSKVGTSMEAVSVVDLNEVIDATCNIYKERMEENNVQLICQSLPKINGVKIQIMQLFQNLVGNAIKYRSQKDPIINIEVEEQEQQWVFSIKDNGIGIPEKYYDKIFVIFKRLHNRKKFSGTGLGLAICKKIVERHGGKIWVNSIEGQGSTFYFDLLK